MSARHLVSAPRTESSKTVPPGVVSARSVNPALNLLQDPFFALFNVSVQEKKLWDLCLRSPKGLCNSTAASRVRNDQ